MSKAEMEAERAALLAEGRLLMREQELSLRIPDDIEGKESLLHRLRDYEKRFAAFRQRVG
jgi:hypothetical protein